MERCTCAECGCELGDRHLDWRFRLPDEIHLLPAGERSPGVELSDPDPERAEVLLRGDREAYLRVLLVVHAADGRTVTFGVWLAVARADLDAARRRWASEGYDALVVDGRLANALPGVDLFGVPVRVSVRHPDHLPYVTASTDATMSALLTGALSPDRFAALLPW
jgi:hypothetical protein